MYEDDKKQPFLNSLLIFEMFNSYLGRWEEIMCFF